jgi:WD40 repeat protein
MNSDADISVATSHFAQRVAELAEKLQAGEEIDLKALCRDSPEQFEQLEMLLPTLQSVVELEHSLAATNGNTGAGAAQGTSSIEQPASSHSLLGDFRILREIGRGGMGVVYEAEQISLRRRVALKVLPFAAILDERQLARFKSEARAAAMLHHTNIVPVFSIGQERGVNYYAMQYIEGITLAQLIACLRQATGRLQTDVTQARANDQTSLTTQGATQISFDSNCASGHNAAITLRRQREAGSPAYFCSVARLGIQIAEALEYAHQRGVIHRDIKPANLMLDTSNNVWITDFGLARLEAEVGLTATGDLIGTLRYMSPEQATEDFGRVDHRTDVYSLGITLYELLALEPAVAGKRRHSMLRTIIDEEPRSLRQLDKAIPIDLDTIVLKAVAKRPEERYATAQDLADDLRKFLAHEPIVARRATLPHRVVKWVRRHRSLVAVTAVSALFSIAVLVASLFWSMSRERERLRELASQQHQEAVRNKTQLDKLTYSLDIGRIEEHRLCQQADLVRSVLDEYRPVPGQVDLRGFEWHYFSQLLDSLQTSKQRDINAHSRQIYCLEFSANGSLLASSSEDAQAKLWKYPSMELYRTLVGHTGDVNWIAFSPDDRTVATCSDDGTVRTWDVESGSERLKFAAYPSWAEDEGQSVAYQIAFSPDGTVLATMHKLHAKLWDAQTGKPLGTLPGRGLAFACSHRWVATAPSVSSIALWNIDSLQQVAAISIRQEEWAQLTTARFDLTDNRLITAGEDGYLTGWSLKWDGSKLISTSRRRIWTGRGKLETVSLLPDSLIAATAGFHGTISVWDLRTLRRIGGQYDHSDRAWSATLSRDQNAVLTSGHDGVISVWNSKSAQLAQWVHRASAFRALSGTYSPGGDTFVWLNPIVTWQSEGDQFYVLNTKTWKQVAAASVRTKSEGEHDSQASLFVNAMAMSPSGRRVAIAGGGGVFMWDHETPKPSFRRVIKWHNASKPSSYPSPVNAPGSAVFLDERRLGVIHAGETVIVDLDLGAVVEQLKPPGDSEGQRRLAISPDGRYLGIGGDEGSCWLYDLVNKQWGPHCRAASQAILAIEFLSPSGLVALGSQDGMITVLDTESLKLIHQMGGHTGPVAALSWDATQNRLVSGGLSDGGRIRLWDVDIGRQVCSFDTEPDCDLYDVDFHPSGQGLTACGVLSETVGKIFHWQLAE